MKNKKLPEKENKKDNKDNKESKASKKDATKETSGDKKVTEKKNDSKGKASTAKLKKKKQKNPTMSLAYRISATVLSLGTIACAFFLKMFTFTLPNFKAILDKTQEGYKHHEFSIYDALKALKGSGVSLGSSGGSEGETTDALMKAIEPMYPSAVKFFVLLAVALVFILVIAILSSATRLRVPQTVLAGVSFILLTVAATYGTDALSYLLEDPITGDPAKISLKSIILASGFVEKNPLLSIGAVLGESANLFKILQASISYGFYVVMIMTALIFIWSLIAAVKCNSEQPKRVLKKHHRAYRRKKPLRKIF